MARNVIRHDFGGVGGSAKRSFTGEAIQEIGHGLSQEDVPTFEKDKEPSKTAPDAAKNAADVDWGSGLQFDKDYSVPNVDLGLAPILARPKMPAGNISNPPAISPTSTNPYKPLDLQLTSHVRTDTVNPTHEDPTRGQVSTALGGPGALERGPNQYNILRGESPFNRNGKDKGKEILGRNDKGEVKVKDARGKEVWVTEAPEGSEEKYEQYLKTFQDQRGPDAVPLDIHHAAASGFASPAQSLLAYKSGGRALGKAVGANKRVPTLQDLETIGLADHPLMKRAYPELFEEGGTPLERNSPFYRIRVDFEGKDEIKPPIQGGSLGARGDIRGAFAAGYNPVIERHNYKQKVWADKAAEADMEFGKLEVEPSGVSAWDASTEIMAREWKTQLGDLLKNKKDLSPEEFVSQKQEILGRSKQYNTAAQAIQKVVADFNENIDNISAGTDPEVMDLLNTLNKGGGAIGVKNINGVPHMTGQTNGGKNIQIPLGEIASGRNKFRFMVKEDIQPGLNAITQNLSKIKKDRAIAGGGLATSTIGWDQLKGSAEPQVDALLNKPATVRAILADRYGYDKENFEELFHGDIDDARKYVKDNIMADLQDQIAPYQQATTIKRDPRAAQQTVKSTAGERSQVQTVQAVQDFVSKNPDPRQASGGWNALLANKGYQIREKDGKHYIVKGKQGQLLPENSNEANQLLAGLSGVATANVGKIGAPTKRIAEEAKKPGPFKRLTNWMTGKK